ncbi:hypothetical protein BC831DRAFT_458518 [Entophlyctis helioformis]|nr:hypothetical protein BC831DRAFT_458518 [Entophlyctis helioformis]
MSQPGSLPWLGMLLAATAVFAAKAAFLVRFWSIPPSRYSHGLRATTAIGMLAVTTAAIMYLGPGFNTHMAIRLPMNLANFAFLGVFVLTELEFLKVLAPFVGGWLSPAAVGWVQLVALCGNLLRLSAAFREYMPARPAFVIDRFGFYWTFAVGAYDFIQQAFLLYFVLGRLKTASVMFRIQYACIVGVSLIVLMLTGIYTTRTVTAGVTDPLVWLALVLAVPIFAMTSFAGMELLRLMLNQSKRGIAAKKPLSLKRPSFLKPKTLAAAGGGGGSCGNGKGSFKKKIVTSSADSQGASALMSAKPYTTPSPSVIPIPPTSSSHILSNDTATSMFGSESSMPTTTRI